MYLSLQYQTTYEIMEEDILNYSPTVMFPGIIILKSQ